MNVCDEKKTDESQTNSSREFRSPITLKNYQNPSLRPNSGKYPRTLFRDIREDYEFQNNCSELDKSPQNVTVSEKGIRKTIPYEEIWSINAVNGRDGNLFVNWHPCKFNKTPIKLLEKIINNAPWDAKGFHKAYIDYEHTIFTSATQAIKYYSNGMKFLEEWWCSFELACHYLAALRDYHDFRMGMKNHFPKDNPIDCRSRHYTHFFRIWNCIMFPDEFRDMLENGSQCIPKSVIQILVEGKTIPYISELDLYEALVKIKSHLNKHIHLS